MTTLTTSARVYPLYPGRKLVSHPSKVDLDALWASANVKVDKTLETRTFFPSAKGEGSVTVVALGKMAPTKDGEREALRKAIATGIAKSKENGAKDIGIVVEESQGHDAAVASFLSLYDFTLKTKTQDPVPTVHLSTAPGNPVLTPQQSIDPSKLSWETGKIYADSQNLARTLAELPANMMTPTIFCETVKKEFKDMSHVEVFTRGEAWAAEQGMRTFLSVTQGTSEPAKFLEIHYKGAHDKNAAPLGLVGKGITFDSGGISLQPGAGMKLMRSDMAGAGAVVSALLAIVKLNLPINVVCCTPLAENMPSGKATKPGDIFTAMNGKTIEVDNTDAEGRLVLSDALTYVSRTFRPHTLIDVATLTRAIVIALGEGFSGVYSTSASLYAELEMAGAAEHDRMWRMPLDEEGFGPSIYTTSNADLCNNGGRAGGSATAALFLKNFVEGIEPEVNKAPTLRWAHLDIAGSCCVDLGGPTPYQRRGMTGRPVRALIEFARRLSLKGEIPDPTT